MTRIRRLLAWWWATARHAWRPAAAAGAWWPWWCLDHDARDVGRAWTRDIAAAQLAGTTGQELGDLHAARRARMAELATPVEERAAAAAVVALAVSVVATVAGATGWLTVAAVVLLAVVAGAAMATATVAGDDGVAAAVAGTAFVANTAVIVAALFLTAVATVAAVVAAGWWLVAGGQWLAIAVVAIVAVAAGWPAGRLAVAMGLVATVRPQVATEVDDDPATGGRLVAAEVMAALADAGLTKVARAIEAGHVARWEERPRHTGHGETATLRLPRGVAVGHVAKVADTVAANLEVATGRLVLDPGATDGHLVVTILDEEPATVPWSLADPATPVDLWAVPVAEATDGHLVELQIPEQSVVMAGLPKTGKTVAMRQVAVAALAGGAEVRVVAGKSGGDWEPVAPFCSFYTAEPETGANAEATLAALQDLDRTWRARSARYRARGWERITPEIAATEGYHLILFILDEIAEVIRHRKYGPEIARLLSEGARLGPAFGVSVLAGTQFPSTQTIPGGLLEACSVRVGFALPPGHRPTNAALGDGAHGRGFRPSELSRKTDAGVSWLVEGAEGRLVRWPLVTAGMITERLAGVVPPAPVAEAVSRGQVLDDVLGCYGPPDDGLQPGYVLECLQTMNPARYGSWTERHLRKIVAVEPARYRPERGGKQVRGWRQIDVVAAFEQEFDVTAPD